MTMFLFKHFYLTCKVNRAQISFWSVFGVLLLLIAYLSSPQTFNNFFSFLINFLFDTLDENFGSNTNGGGKTTPSGK